MKFLNWNILSGGSARKEKVFDYIDSCDADVVILTEFRQSESGQFLCSQLKGIGLVNQTMTSFKSNRHNGVLLVSRCRLSVANLPSVSTELSSNVLACTIDEIKIIATFCSEQITFDALMTYMESIPSSGTLLTGDLLHGERRSNPSHYEKSLKRLLVKDWVDCWKKDNVGSNEYCHTNSANGGQSRPDHVFADAQLASKITDCWYDQSPLYEHISDHAPMHFKVDV